jgi:hypothetical protein
LKRIGIRYVDNKQPFKYFFRKESIDFTLPKFMDLEMISHICLLSFHILKNGHHLISIFLIIFGLTDHEA